MNRLERLLEEKRYLLLDGGTGTNLFSLGLQSGDPPEIWNYTEPEKVRLLYRSYIQAGSDVILSNSFGGNTYRLSLHNRQEDVHRINVQAAKLLAQEIADSGKDIVAAGCMGPTGEIIEPNGPLSLEDAKRAYSFQAAALKEGGADIIWIETISSLEEMKAAVMGAAKTGLPIVLTMSFDSNGRTMMGVTPSNLRDFQNKLQQKPLAIGANCGAGAAELVAAIINMGKQASYLSNPPVYVAKANCGIPELIDGKICYSGTPEMMAKFSTMAIDAGARLIGGCCGTTPKHISAMRRAIDNHQRSPSPTIEEIELNLGTLSAGARAQMSGDMSRLGGSTSQRKVRKHRGARKSKLEKDF